jgi:hypothetical protein
MVQKNGKAVLIDFGIAGEIIPQDAIDNFMEITLERIFYYQAVIIVAVISHVYFYPKEKLEKYFSRLPTSLIMICTSYLGLFLGWLIYKLFPIFGNR